jgi:hypothetical protein
MQFPGGIFPKDRYVARMGHTWLSMLRFRVSSTSSNTSGVLLYQCDATRGVFGKSMLLKSRE